MCPLALPFLGFANLFLVTFCVSTGPWHGCIISGCRREAQTPRLRHPNRGFGMPRIHLTPVLPGQQFSQLTVHSELPEHVFPCGITCRVWLCLCSCGNFKEVREPHLRSEHTKSCGCLHTIHGLTKTTEFDVWSSIKKRCLNPNHKSYADYGGRGITICPEWRDSFATFLADMGPRPSPQHSIDRIDVNGNYCKENCRWATPREQQNNRRNNHLLTFNGTTMTLAEWSRLTLIHKATLRWRISMGWSSEDVLIPPPSRH
jgi:hypothetical protein